MPYINTQTNQYPVSEQDIRNLNPNTSFPSPFIAPDEYAVVFPAPAPTYDPITQAVRETTPILTSKGHYEQAWEVVPRFNDYTDEDGVEHTRKEQEAAAIAEHQAQAKQTLITSVQQATQARLDTFARSRNYDDVNSAAKYKDITDAEIAALPDAEKSLVIKFRTEARYLAIATAATWARLYMLMAEVEAGQRPMPSSFADIEPDLPELVWPA